jgi:membrane-bound inhibitor of C-type lysozyme
MLSLAGVLHAQEPVVVIGSGDPEKDVPAVQAAIDRGGTVVLKGTFDFGERGRVTIRRDVSISGETGPSHDRTWGTTIKGGFWTFFSPPPAGSRPGLVGPQISIRDLHFDGALWAPINIAHASGITVRGNRITNVRPHPLTLPNIPDGYVQQGIVCGTRWAQEDQTKRKYLPDIVTGSVMITENEIDLTAPEPLKTLAQGSWVMWTTGIDAYVARNRISGVSRNSIEAIDNYQGAGGKGRVRVDGNTITTPRSGIPLPTPATPNGVVVGFFVDPDAAVDPSRNIRYEVQRNVIEVRGNTSLGIAVFSDGAVVMDNTVSASGTDAQAIYVASSNGEVVKNTLRGTGKAGIAIAPFRAMTARANRLAGNDMRQFEASEGHARFTQGSGNNVCTGNQGLVKVADLGSGNRCP